jgi:hypothetical protein
MTTLRWKEFSGIAPRIAPRLLPPNMAKDAYNVKPWSGELRAFKNTLKVAALAKTGDVKGLYLLASLYWLSWEYAVNVAKAPIPDDDTGRIYFTGESQEPRVTNTDLATTGGTNYPEGWYALGVPAPLTAPTVAHTGGAGADETRAYVYTFVTQWGEESAPSPQTSYTGKADAASFDLSGMNTAPLNTGSIAGATHSAGWITVETTAAHWLRDHHAVTIADVVGMTDLNGSFRVVVVDATHFKVQKTTAQAYTSGGTWERDAPYNTTGLKQRIYRTFGGKFYFVVEQNAAATYTDSVTNAALVLNEQLETTDWDMPPGNLEGLVVLPNGVMVGFVGNLIYPSEPYKPYAFPVKYIKTLPHKIKALGNYGTTIVAATEGKPYRVDGSDPSFLRESVINDPQPCASGRGAVSLDNTVMFPAASGLYAVGGSGHAVVTRELLTRDDWQLRKPTEMIGAFVDQRYVAFYKSGTENGADVGYGFMFDRREGKDALIEIGFYATALHNDDTTDLLYLVRKIDGANEVHQWEGAETSRLQYQWRSGTLVAPHLTNMAYALVDGEFGQGRTPEEIAECQSQAADVVGENEALIASGEVGGALNDEEVNLLEINGDFLLDVPSCEGDDGWVIFRLYGDGVLRHEESVFSREPFVLPAGYLSKDYEVQALGNVDVHEIMVAESYDELAEA